MGHALEVGRGGGGGVWGDPLESATSFMYPCLDKLCQFEKNPTLL